MGRNRLGVPMSVELRQHILRYANVGEHHAHSLIAHHTDDEVASFPKKVGFRLVCVRWREGIEQILCFERGNDADEPEYVVTLVVSTSDTDLILISHARSSVDEVLNRDAVVKLTN